MGKKVIWNKKRNHENSRANKYVSKCLFWAKETDRESETDLVNPSSVDKDKLL